MKLTEKQLRNLISKETKSILRESSSNKMSLKSLLPLIFEGEEKEKEKKSEDPGMDKESAAELIQKNVTEPIAKGADKSTVEQIVGFLNSAEGQDATVRQLLASGEKDGEPSDEAISVEEGASFPCLNFAPSQSQIGLPNSIGFAFSTKGKSALDASLSGDVQGSGVIACGSGDKGSTFIVDGHHRWSSALVVNPDANISVTLIKADNPFKALAISQVVIATYKDGKLPSSTSEPDTNLLSMGKDEIKKYCIANVGKVLDKNATEFLSDDIIDFLAEKKYGGATPQDDRNTKLDKICEQIAVNCKKVPKAGDAPARKDMPQFDAKVGGPKFAAVQDKFTSGETNFKDPVVPEATQHEGSIMLERWHKLAGIIK